MSKIRKFLTFFFAISLLCRLSYAQSEFYEEEINCGSESFPMITKGATVMLIGDSLASGMEQKFISLARRSGYVPVSHTANGSSIFQWIKWIKNDLEKNRPELVIISLGTNDATIYGKVIQNQKLYQDLFKEIEDSGAVHVWIEPPNISKKRIPKISETKNIIRKFTVFSFESEKIGMQIGNDGVHPSALGYSKWMESVWNWMIQKNIVEPQ